MASATACAKVLARSQSAPSIGSTTCNPLPPESLTKLLRSSAASRSRTSRAAATTPDPSPAPPGLMAHPVPIATAGPTDLRAAPVPLGPPRLHQREQPVQVFERDDLPALGVGHGAQLLLAEPGRGVLLEEALALGAF